MEDTSGRLSNDMFVQGAEEGDKESKANKMTTKKIIIISIIVLICLIGIGLLIYFILKEEEEEKKDEPFIPIPQNEDLDFTEEAHRLFSREVATQTMVLATNNDVLPLKSTDQVVLFGDGSNNTIYGGWGSGEVYNKGTPDGLTPVKIYEGIENIQNNFTYIKNDKGYEIGFPGSNLTEEDIQQFAVKRDKVERTVAILTISRRSGEGSDRPQDKSNSGTLISDTELNTFNALIKYFDKIVVILNVGSVIELQDIEKNEKTSILISFLPGMESGNAIADVLIGKANPSGHLTDTWAKTIADYPTTATFTESIQYVKYKEGLFVGYRYFEEDGTTQGKVVFPFGHGLSYTQFSMDNKCQFNQEKNIFEIQSEIKNIGKFSGKQVIQIYAKKLQNEKFIKVQRELVAFAKTKELQPGESQILSLNVELDYLASYDDTGVTGNRACYVLEKGEYILYAGFSVADTRVDKSIIYRYTQNELKVVQKLKNRVVPHDPEVADANTKPIFSKLFNNDNTKKEKKINDNYRKEKTYNYTKVKQTLLDNNQNTYTELPIDKFNEINFKSVLEKKYTMEQLVDSMSNEELTFLSYGKSPKIRAGTGIIGGFYNAGITGKYRIPGGDTLDGPAGLRQSEVSMGSTGWPCSTALASSFDIDLIKKVGEETGKEARKIGCFFWLAPAINIHRNPLCGRNFEYYSEDPYLTGMMASAITQGLQSKRVSITLKHFAVNNKEQNRNGDDDKQYNLASDSRMAERVAREIYLRGFEIAVKKADPWSIMTSYNRMNGMKTAESYDLLTGILRDEWGYKGLVMTDWGTRSKNDREAHAGNGVKMPNNGDGSATILNGLISGSVTRDDLKKNILYVFNTLSKTAAIDKLFLEPEKVIKISNNSTKIKIFDNIYQKSAGISYEDCKDADGGENPTSTSANTWITLYVDCPEEQYRLVRIRYSSIAAGFGVSFSKYGENLGEITNLENTGDLQKWNTSSITNVKFPKGKYELTLRFLYYDYTDKVSIKKGNINYIEILKS